MKTTSSSMEFPILISVSLFYSLFIKLSSMLDGTLLYTVNLLRLSPTIPHTDGLDTIRETLGWRLDGIAATGVLAEHLF